MPLVPNLGPAVAAVWGRVRTILPDSCLSGADESLHFAKYGRRPGDTELAAMSGKDGASANGAVGGAAGEHAEPTGTIDEWQAGWNVTNAIQVSSLSDLCDRGGPGNRVMPRET